MLELQKPGFRRKILEDDLKYWPKERLEQRVAFFAKQQPNKIAVIDPWKTLTYYELDKMINDVAVTMKGYGIEKNSVVMIQLPNIVESMVVFHASLRSGAIVLPVTPIYRKSEINSIINQVKPDIIFAPTFF